MTHALEEQSWSHGMCFKLCQRQPQMVLIVARQVIYSIDKQGHVDTLLAHFEHDHLATTVCSGRIPNRIKRKPYRHVLLMCCTMQHSFPETQQERYVCRVVHRNSDAAMPCRRKRPRHAKDAYPHRNCRK